MTERIPANHLFRRAAVAIVTALLLAGCTEYLDHSDKIAPFAGDATKSNIASQMIDPWPRHSGDNHIHTEGNRMAVGMDRYKKNESLEPRGLETSSIKTSGSGGGEEN